MDAFLQTEFDVTKISTACHVPAGKSSLFHRNRPHYGIAFFESGEKEYTFSDGLKLTAHENDVLFFPFGSTYTIADVHPGACWAINFDLRENVSLAPFVIHMKNDTLAKRFMLARELWCSRQTGYILKCKAELYNILYTMQTECRAAYVPSKKELEIRPAVKFIHENYTSENLRVDVLAEMCGITPEYFRKLFRTFYGTSPLSYTNTLKINHAKELLSAGLYSVTEAAFLSGYTDSSHFSRAFKKETGMSPSEYAKKARSDE